MLQQQTSDLATRMTQARSQRGGMQEQIQLLTDESIGVRRALEKAETDSERTRLEERLVFLRDALSECHAGLIQAHNAYDAVRKDGIWGRLGLSLPLAVRACGGPPSRSAT